MTPNDDASAVSIDYAQRRADRAAARRAQRRVAVPWVAVAAVALVITGILTFEFGYSYGRIHSGVSVSGIAVGRMTPEQAASELQTALPAKTREPVTVVYQDEKWEVTAEEIELTFDYEALSTQAMAVGRDGGVLRVVSDRVGAWASGVEVPATASADAEKLDDLINKVAKGTDVAPVDATLKIKELKPVLIPAKPGVELKRDELKTAILGAMLSTRRTVEAPTRVADVGVTDDEAKAAAAVAQTMLAGPVTITYKSKDWEFTPEEVASWLSFRRSDDTATADVVPRAANERDVTLVPLVSSKKAAKTVVPRVGAKVGREAKNARFKTSSGRVTIIPSEDGIGPDMKDLARTLTASLSAEDSSRTVAMRTAVTKPKITTEDAEKMGVKERLSRYTTTYAAGNRSRVNNIHLLGDALDGTLVAPGKTFSFNGSIGQRTAEKGYQEANAIVNGELVPQLGGGICQVGTTIFNTVFESGLPVVQRRNHSFYIDHYPKGRDATVSWGGPDFKFKNDTEHWVLISVSYTSSSITIALYGTDPGYEVESETGKWRNIKPHPVKEIKDKTMAKGVKVVEDAGVDGKSITVKRTVSKDGEVIRTDSFVSVYKPKTETVRVGTKKVEPTEPEETTEEPEPDQ